MTLDCDGYLWWCVVVLVGGWCGRGDEGGRMGGGMLKKLKFAADVWAESRKHNCDSQNGESGLSASSVQPRHPLLT